MQKQGQYETCSDEQSAYRFHRIHPPPDSQRPQMRAFFRTPAISWFSEHVEVSKMLGALRHHADGLGRVCKGNEIKQGRVNVKS